jgi:hypothetical protein
VNRVVDGDSKEYGGKDTSPRRPHVQVAGFAAFAVLALAAPASAPGRSSGSVPKTLATGSGKVLAVSTDGPRVAWLLDARCGDRVHVVDASGRLATIDGKSCRFDRAALDSDGLVLAGDRVYWNHYEVANTEMQTLVLTASVADPTTRSVYSDFQTGCEDRGCWVPEFARDGRSVFFSTRTDVRRLDGLRTPVLLSGLDLGGPFAIDGSTVAVQRPTIPADPDAGQFYVPAAMQIRSRRNGALRRSIGEPGVMALVDGTLVVVRSIYPRSSLAVYDEASGRLLWRRPAHMLSTIAVAGSRLVFFGRNGWISLLDPRSRRVTRLFHFGNADIVAADARAGRLVWVETRSAGRFRVRALTLPR